ncbi:hypothetical protein [Clavibacter nebraskensis]|uniref:hypothetical protein n=1 Tax=Clavibacter nebraskensis TaxID=31963 RepID=UPI003F4CAD3D
MTTDRLTELRDLITATAADIDDRRSQQRDLLPALRATPTSATALAEALGISRAAFYKNGYNAIQPLPTIGGPAGPGELLERVRELTTERVELEAKMSGFLYERNALIDAALAAEDGPTWAEICEQAGISDARVSQVNRRPSA